MSNQIERFCSQPGEVNGTDFILAKLYLSAHLLSRLDLVVTVKVAKSHKLTIVRS